MIIVAEFLLQIKCHPAHGTQLATAGKILLYISLSYGGKNRNLNKPSQIHSNIIFPD